MELPIGDHVSRPSQRHHVPVLRLFRRPMAVRRAWREKYTSSNPLHRGNPRLFPIRFQLVCLHANRRNRHASAPRYLHMRARVVFVLGALRLRIDRHHIWFRGVQPESPSQVVPSRDWELRDSLGEAERHYIHTAVLVYPHRVRCTVVRLHDGFLQAERARQTRWGGALLSQHRLDGINTSVREEKVFREETERLGRVHYFMVGVGTEEKWVAWVRQIFGSKSAVTRGNFLTQMLRSNIKL